MRLHTDWTRLKVATAGLGLVAATLISSSVSASNPSPAFIPPTADWLTTVNYYRAMAGVGQVVEDSTMSAGAELHSCYMLYNGISHDELPGRPGYTAEGDVAGNSGNVAVSSQMSTSARSHIELWMSGPFHAIGVLRHNLQSTGFGKCDLADTPTWHSGATLDVLRGLGSSPRPAFPILFPGNGTTTNLDRFVVETPDPLTFCGWSGPAGLPIIAMMPEAATSPTGAITGPNGPIDVCILSAANTTGTAKAILQGDNAVVVVPRTVLSQGSYNVTVTTSARAVNWGFAVDSAAATGIIPPSNAVISGLATGLQPMNPVRLVDTREGFGTSRLSGQMSRRIQIAGREGVPSAAKALLANITVTAPTGPGFLTLWNCSDQRPLVSTVNFAAGDSIANAATVPLDATGGLCAYSSVTTEMVIDASGYYSTTAPGRYSSVEPRRMMDTRVPLGPSGRLVGGQTVELAVTGAPGAPAAITAVALNVTGIFPDSNGYLTVYPCGTTRPFASSLNPVVGKVKPNLVIVPVSSSGTVCVYSLTEVDVVVDVVGYISSTTTAKLTPTTPFRFMDTRDQYQTEMNNGNNGLRLAAGQITVVPMAGQRGIPSNAKSISANLTATEAVGPGFLTAWSCGSLPIASNVNYDAGGAVANAASLPLSSAGEICIYSSESVHVIIDVNGWWS